jgi:hypothetical protein
MTDSRGRHRIWMIGRATAAPATRTRGDTTDSGGVLIEPIPSPWTPGGIDSPSLFDLVGAENSSGPVTCGFARATVLA